MVRFIVLAAATLVLAAVPLGGAEARSHRATPAESAHGHGKKPTHAEGRSRGHAHGRSRQADDDYDDAPRHRSHGRPVHDRYAQSPSRPAPVQQAQAAPRAAPKSIDEALEAASDLPPPPASTPAPYGGTPGGVPGGGRPMPQVLIPPQAPDSPAGKVKHANPAPGIVVVSNPDIWAERREAEHRNRATATRLTLASMVGRSDTDLRSALGMPDLQRTEGDGALWTYRMPSCALMVFLRRSSGVAFKVTGAQTGPLARGNPAPDVDACLRTAGSR